MARKKVYKGGKVPPPKQTSFGKQMREARKKLRQFGGRRRG